jgi:hypothetical protein
MDENNTDLTNIDFDNDWEYYCQLSNDKTDKRTFVSSTYNIESDDRWSLVELPHIIDDTERSCKCWYRKQFDWTPTNQQLEEQVYLNFESLDYHNQKCNINATIWFNNTQIFSGSLNLLYDENKESPMLVICCMNTSLSIHTSLVIHGKVICATGQVTINERNVNINKDSDEIQNDILDYTVTVDNNDGRIDVVFNPTDKSKTLSTVLKQPFQLINDQNQVNEDQKNVDDDLLIPRLAIVILIIGTRGDVQPFIA